MSILVVGSIAYDDVETPFGKVLNSPGGSACHFSAAASLFAPVNMVGVVGNDFNFTDIEFLRAKNVDFSGIKVEKGKTFRWGGKYQVNLNIRDTLYTHLNVFETFNPEIPESYRNSKIVFLANIDPQLQLNVLEQMNSPDLIILDTMNFWITGKRNILDQVIKKVDVMILNDEELQLLTGQFHLPQAAKTLLKMGPKILVIKKGEHGAVLVSKDDFFISPAYPLDKVEDPTGAGDSFAGGFVGYLAQCPKITSAELRKAVIFGTIIASFNVEAFSFLKLKSITMEDVNKRVEQFRAMLSF